MKQDKHISYTTKITAFLLAVAMLLPMLISLFHNCNHLNHNPQKQHNVYAMPMMASMAIHHCKDHAHKTVQNNTKETKVSTDEVCICDNFKILQKLFNKEYKLKKFSTYNTFKVPLLNYTRFSKYIQYQPELRGPPFA